MSKKKNNLAQYVYIALKDFLKQYMNGPYSYIRNWILYFAHTRRRQNNLKKFLRRFAFFPLTYKNISFLISLDPQNGYIDEKIFDQGYFEPEMLDAFLRYLKPGMTFVDIGANIGQHTLFVSRIVGASGNVISFEPIPHLYEQIKRSVHANAMTNCNIINAGCGEKEETKTLYINKANIGGSSLVVPSINSNDGEISIKILKAEDILLDYEKIDLIKIDVEGYEYQALLGLEKIIARDKPVFFIEYSPSFYKRDVQNQEENDGLRLLALLQKYGYKIKDLDDTVICTSNTIIEWGRDFDESTKHLPHQQTNIICYTS